MPNAIETLKTNLEKIGNKESLPLTAEQKQQWQVWQRWARTVAERDAGMSDIVIQDSLVSRLNAEDDEPDQNTYKEIERESQYADSTREHVQELLVSLTKKSAGCEIYLYDEYSQVILTTSSRLIEYLRSHYAELLAGKDVPCGIVHPWIVDAKERNAQLAQYAEGRLKELEKYQYDQPLIVTYANDGNPWATTAGELKNYYSEYNIGISETENNMGGIMVLAEHGDLEKYEEDREIEAELEHMKAEEDYYTQESVTRQEACLEWRNKLSEKIIAIGIKQESVRLKMPESEKAMDLDLESALQLVANLRDEDLEYLRIIES